MSEELNEELLEETPEEIDSTSPAELSVEPPTVKNPGVSTGSWLFAAVSGAFLVALVVVSMLIPTVETAMDSRDAYLSDIWGTNIYKAEGCGECHSRFVRKADSGYGSPATLATLSEIGIDMGTSRIGGDIQNISGKYTFHELVSRFENPGTLQPGTVMPSYKHLDGLETVALINYLQAPIRTFDRWQTLRNVNGIETSVPDQILSELVEYFDPDSGEFFSPVPLSTSLAVIGSGIYSSRCASCHNSDSIGDLNTDVYLYWKISDGSAGSEMPAWRGTISETGIWYTIAYIGAGRSIAAEQLFYDEVTVEPEESLWYDLSISEEEMQLLFPSWEDDNSGDVLSVNISENIRDTADPASEEEGVSMGEASADADGSAAEPDAGEGSR